MVIMYAVLLGILTLGVINFVRAVTRKGVIALQALAAIVIWVVFSYALMLILATVTWSLRYPRSQADELKITAAFAVVTLVEAAVGAALVYWTRRQARLSTAIDR
jgi:hypothetical protein